MPAGNVGEIIFGFQSAKGTALTPTAANTSRSRVSDGWLRPVKETADLEETTGTRLRDTSFTTMVRADGTPVFFARPGMIARLLYAAMGAKATTGSVDPWTHTLTLALTQPWMTFWTNFVGTLFQRFVDCKVSSLVLESAAGQPMRVTVGVVGIDPNFESAAETTAAAEIVVPFMHYDGRLALLIENVAVSSIDTFKLTINTGVTAAQGDAVTADSINEGQFDITLETGQILQDFALWNRLHYGSSTPADNAPVSSEIIELGGSPAGIDFLFTRTAAAPGPERSLRITATRLQIADFGEPSAPNTSGEPLRQAVTYRVRQPASGSGLTAVVKNGIAIP